MTREERLDWLCRLRSDIPYMDFSIDMEVSLERKRQYRQALSETIKALEQEPRWIPVSERLPEPDVEVLVTDDACGLATISTDSIYESEATGEKEWYTSQRVTAWMPLPKPYREVEK
jgi:hypothetical protein